MCYPEEQPSQLTGDRPGGMLVSGLDLPTPLVRKGELWGDRKEGSVQTKHNAMAPNP